ncbi:MAG TPA: zf-HC2 domain-containing protein [bacterium]|nr:zf-HC2 domain-containing protein [bacterium]
MSGHVSDQLSAYIDGALGVQDVERVKAHLDICPRCQQEYRGVQEVQRLLRALPDPTPPAGFLDRVHWRLQREAAGHPRPGLVARVLGVFTPRPLRLALAASALVLILGLPWAWMTGQFGPRQAPLDTDAYLRHYFVLSADRSLADEATTTFVSFDLGLSEQPTR